jgi:hypothetical protein
MTPPQLKKALVSAGFEVFRTLADEIVLAERVRENLILDSGVRVHAQADDSFVIKLVMRAERRDFPHDDEQMLFARVRRLASPALDGGFGELATQVTHVQDPSDPTKTLDTFFEVIHTKAVKGDMDRLTAELRTALAFEKTAGA